MTDLIELQNKIEQLQKQASEIKTREFDKTVQELLAKMTAFGITLKDLQQPQRRGGKRKAKSAPSAKPVSGKKGKPLGKAPIKYRGPNGEVWSGRGVVPRWMAALMAQGQTKEQFFIKS